MTVAENTGPILRIPKYFQARSYQAEFYEAMRTGAKRAALIWHRRAGKDATTLNWIIEAMVRRVGTYFYFLPTYAQGKKIIWDGIQGDGFPFLRHFPDELQPHRNETEMKITIANGSVFQVIGADNIDSIVGTNPVGVVFSEYSLMSPRAWDLMRPILAENGGWAVFVFTPRGRNWGHKLWQSAYGQPGWFTSIKTVNDTRRDGPNEDGSPVITPDAIQAERDAGMSEELIQQEFYCSFEGAMQGSYYGDLIDKMRKDGRITAVPWERNALVDTSWDLGVNNETVVGFWQDIDDLRSGARRLALIDLLVGSREGLDEYWRQMKTMPYTYGRHFGPHDLKVQEWGSGNTRLQTAWKIGLNFEVQPKLSIADGILATRRMLPWVWCDETKGAAWIDAMSAYRREFDDRTQSFRDTPVHDPNSNYADMTRYRAIAFDGKSAFERSRDARRPRRYDTSYSVFDKPRESRRPGINRSGPDWGRIVGT